MKHIKLANVIVTEEEYDSTTEYTIDVFEILIDEHGDAEENELLKTKKYKNSKLAKKRVEYIKTKLGKLGYRVCVEYFTF